MTTNQYFSPSQTLFESSSLPIYYSMNKYNDWDLHAISYESENNVLITGNILSNAIYCIALVVIVMMTRTFKSNNFKCSTDSYDSESSFNQNFDYTHIQDAYLMKTMSMHESNIKELQTPSFEYGKTMDIMGNFKTFQTSSILQEIYRFENQPESNKLSTASELMQELKKSKIFNQLTKCKTKKTPILQTFHKTNGSMKMVETPMSKTLHSVLFPARYEISPTFLKCNNFHGNKVE